MGTAGLERLDVTGNGDNGLGNQADAGAAFALHSGPETAEFDAGLARVVEAWPTLLADVKRAMLSLVESAVGVGE